MLNKNEVYKSEVISNGFMGEGICRIDNQVVFVPNVVRGEKIELRVLKVNKNFAFGKLEKIIKESPLREEPICPVFYKCGGCDLQHIEYDEQLRIKKAQVESCLKKENIIVKVNNVIGMGLPYYYREKVGYPVRINSEGKNVIGFYSKRSHVIVENNICYIQDKDCDKVAKITFDVINNLNLKGYSEENNRGDIKHIVVRKGYHTNEVMVILVTTKKSIKNIENIVEELVNKDKNIKTIVQNINTSVENDILGNENIVLYGDGYITDIIENYKYKISASSFYQVNPIQTEVLYNLVKENLGCNKEMTVLDLYSGVGTIGIFVANSVKKVYGIEIVKEAVDMAKENAKLNNITNVEYICGQAEEKINELLNKSEKIDAIIVDPPRKGLDEKIIEVFKDIKCSKIVYVSCNPATLARDIKLLSNEYVVKTIQPVDLFPQTAHVECVVVLGRK